MNLLDVVWTKKKNRHTHRQTKIFAMAWKKNILVFGLVVLSAYSANGSPARGGKSGGGGGPKTCPGYPGYCSESYPGDTCLVVCAFGRNNVPECQADGTWTDIPRCIEHEPGIPNQVPGLCPGIPGYCSLEYPGGVCEFDCISGPDIRSFCTPDGTWDPYPTCDGDVRETRDGCDPCPGPFGGPRNRTTEAASGTAPARKPAPAKSAPQQPQQVSAPANSGNKKQGQANNNGNNRQQAQPAQNNNRPQQAAQNNNNQKQNGNNGGRNNKNGNGRPQQPSQHQQPPQQHQQPPQQHQQTQQHQQSQPQQQQQQHQQSQSGGSAPGCPGGSLEACIDVCPSDSARIFGACVNGCARRCPSKK